MKVQIQKKLLVDALDKMHDVSTKALIPDYNFSGRITVEVQSSKVIFSSSNGCVTAKFEITDKEDENVKGGEKGKVTTDAIKFRDSVRKIITSDSSSPIELSDDEDVFLIRDANSKRKKLVKLPCENNHHKTELIQKPDSDSTFIEVDPFLRGVTTVLPFQCRASYKFAYQNVCFHWKDEEFRTICGDGSLFAVFTFPRNKKDKKRKKEIKRTVPGTQLSVISSLLQNSTGDIELVWSDQSTLWMKDNSGIELIARGLPGVDYVAYDIHAYRFDEAKAYMDIKISDLKEVSGLLNVLHDKEREEQGKCHQCIVKTPSTEGHVKFEISQDQGKWRCEYEIPVTYYDLGEQPEFCSTYAHLFFDSPVHASRHSYLRFYLINEIGTVNARDVDLGEIGEDGIPVVKDEPDDCTLSFFFASVAKED